MIGLTILAAALLVGGVGFFAVKAWRADRATVAIEAEEKQAEEAMEHDAIDDAFAHDIAARARDKGAV